MGCHPSTSTCLAWQTCSSTRSFHPTKARHRLQTQSQNIDCTLLCLCPNYPGLSVETHNACSIPRNIPRGVIKAKRTAWMFFLTLFPRATLLLCFSFFSLILQIHFCPILLLSCCYTLSPFSIDLSQCGMLIYYTPFMAYCLCIIHLTAACFKARCTSLQRWIYSSKHRNQ